MSRNFVLVLFLSTFLCLSESWSQESSAPRFSEIKVSQHKQETIRVYGVEFFRSPYFKDVALATVEQIRKAVAPRFVTVKNVKLDDLDRLIVSQQADVVITISRIYRRHLRNGMRDIVTLSSPLQPDPDHAVGSLLLVKRGSGLKTWSDLRGKRILLNTPTSYQGTLTIKKEILDRGWNPEKFFGRIIYAGHNVENRLELLRRDEADATFVSACVVEREAALGHNLLEEFEPAAVRTDVDGNCLSSTWLYPNHTLLTSSQLDAETVRRIAASLHEMPVTQSGYKWVIASSFQPVDEVYRALKIGPYEYLNSWTIGRIWQEYGFILSMALVAFAFALWHVWRTSLLVSKATEEIRAATKRQKERALHYEAIKRTVAVANLSNIVVHELGQPLSAILFRARILRKLFPRLNPQQEVATMLEDSLADLERQAKRTGEIINLVRGYAKTAGRAQHILNASSLVEQAVERFVEEYPESTCAINLSLDAKAQIRINALEFELAVGNLIKNAWEACSWVDRPRIEITCQMLGSEVEISVSDNGPAVSQKALDAMSKQMVSAKAEGLGLGLAIVRTVARQSLGRFKIEPKQPNGVVAKMTLPLAKDSISE